MGVEREGPDMYMYSIYLQKWRENGSMVEGGESGEKNNITVLVTS
jgi:hypothetical protein